MPSLKSIVLLLALIPLLVLANHQAHFKFLSNLVRGVRAHREVKMVFMLQSQASKNCDIQDWRPLQMPMLRANELAVFEIYSNFNEYYTLGLVCITQMSELSLLDKLALDYDQMRQERVILWIQVKITGKLLRKISKLLEKHHFTKVVLVEIVNRNNATYNIHRLNAFPKAKFERIDNLSQVTDIYPRSLVNFQGRNTVVLPKTNALFTRNVSYGPKRYFPISTCDDILIIEFARKYNLSLQLSTRTMWHQFDLQLTPRLVSRVEIAECVNPFAFVSLVAVVPCGKELGVQEVFKQLDFGLVLRYLLPVYVAFVVVESFILLIKARIHNETHRFSYLDPLANMRALSAILGMSFPVSPRWNSSLRQLFLVLSIFGFVLSNFFACKLSSHLTKRSRCHEVKNFEEFRDSGLEVIVDADLCNYILTDINPAFFSQITPNAKCTPSLEIIKHTMSLNDSVAYFIQKENWQKIKRYQESLGRKVLCSSKNLTIISNLQKMHFLPKNSIFKWPLRAFAYRLYESGIHMHWEKKGPDQFKKLLNITIAPVPKTEAAPLTLHHFYWVWTLLFLGYGFATMVFCIELCLMWG
ncbi:hypothetical protein KR074_012196 [Drosophila pseudoananassae]|nr:hypothetical protein KR074_012196 [Drosophila pseudoananassae]